MKTKYLYYFTLAALVFVLFGSVNHLALALESFEKDGHWLVAWSIAIGTELFMILTALGLTVARNLKGEIKKSVPMLTFILFFFAFINLCGNIYYSFTVLADVDILEWDNITALDPLKIISVFTFSFPLPFMAVAGSILQGIFQKAYEKEDSDYQKKLEKIEAERKKANENSKIIDNDIMSPDNKGDIIKPEKKDDNMTQNDTTKESDIDVDKIIETKEVPDSLVDAVEGGEVFDDSATNSETIFNKFSQGKYENDQQQGEN